MGKTSVLPRTIQLNNKNKVIIYKFKTIKKILLEELRSQGKTNKYTLSNNKGFEMMIERLYDILTLEKKKPITKIKDMQREMLKGKILGSLKENVSLHREFMSKIKKKEGSIIEKELLELNLIG